MVKGVTTFSDNNFFKTVFVSGDDMVAEEKALKAKEHADWEKRIIVESKNFAVNTKPLHSQQVDKHKGLREAQIKKIGLRLGQKKLQHLQNRQIAATKGAPLPPVSALSKEQYVDDTSYKPTIGLLPNFERTPGPKDGSSPQRDFLRHSRHGVTMQRAVSNKVFIQPLKDIERVGPKWSLSKKVLLFL